MNATKVKRNVRTASARGLPPWSATAAPGPSSAHWCFAASLETLAHQAAVLGKHRPSFGAGAVEPLLAALVTVSFRHISPAAAATLPVTCSTPPSTFRTFTRLAAPLTILASLKHSIDLLVELALLLLGRKGKEGGHAFFHTGHHLLTVGLEVPTALILGHVADAIAKLAAGCSSLVVGGVPHTLAKILQLDDGWIRTADVPGTCCDGAQKDDAEKNESSLHVH